MVASSHGGTHPFERYFLRFAFGSYWCLSSVAHLSFLGKPSLVSSVFGYKRFFNTLLFFYSGFILIIFSGNLETLFIGWEILGISSFLLIAFYRDRYLPVKNAVKVFSIYRIGDVGLILVMWLSHHIWNANISFDKLFSAELVHAHFEELSSFGLIVAVLIYITAAAKSAQFPFSSWLPRAIS